MFKHIFKDFLGIPYVEQDVTTITIGGFSVSRFRADMKKIWGSDKVFTAMFTHESRYSITFNRFFGVDILYMLEQVSLFKKRTSNRYRITKLIDLLQEETWLRSLGIKHQPILDRSKLSTMFHQPMPHQWPAFDAYDTKIPRMDLHGFLLAADVGTGKTYISLALSAMLESEIVIIFSPKSILDRVWTDSIREEFGQNAAVWSVTFNKPMTPNYKFYVANYEYLNNIVRLAPVLRSKRSMIIVDESHNFNDPDSLRSIRLAEFCKESNCKHVIFSSGTAVKALGYEMITLLRCIDPIFDKDSEQRFRKIYGISAKRAVDILRHRLDLVGHKIPKSLVMKIPKPIVIKKRVKLPNGKEYTVEAVKKKMRAYVEEKMKFYLDNMKTYDATYRQGLDIYRSTIKTSQERAEFDKYLTYVNEIRKAYDPKTQGGIIKFCNEFEKRKIIPKLPSNLKAKFKDAKSVVKYVQLKVMGEALGNVLLRLRAECHVSMVRHCGLIEIAQDADKKLLCFTSFVDVVKETELYFRENGFNPRTVYGETNKFVGTTIADFRSQPDINPLVATYPSLNAGVTLVNCSVVCLLDMPPRDYIYEQSVHRIYRIGQDTQTYVVECTLDTGAEPNISTRSEDILRWSKEQVDAILGRNLSSTEFVGIVEYLNLNPKTPFERIVKAFGSLFN